MVHPWNWLSVEEICASYVFVCTVDKLLEVLCFLQIFDAAQFLDFSYYLLYRMHDFVSMCNGWIGDSFVLEVYCVGEPFFFCVFDVACMRLVVIW